MPDAAFLEVPLEGGGIVLVPVGADGEAEWGEPDAAGDDEAEFDCGMLRSGQCLKAGSEECDWECPNGAVAGKRRRLHAR